MLRGIPHAVFQYDLFWFWTGAVLLCGMSFTLLAAELYARHEWRRDHPRKKQAAVQPRWRRTSPLAAVPEEPRLADTEPIPRYDCDRCKDSKTIWDGSRVIRCPDCS